MPIEIDYLGHSGFFVETDKTMLLFDYYYGDLSFLEEKSNEKPLFVFSSHGHGDHFNPEIFSIVKTHQKTIYLLSFDIKGKPGVPENRDIRYLDADKTYEIEELGTVNTLISTDEGIAFLIKTSNETLFYAGDLHWWDWPGEDPEWLAEQEIVFKREIGKLKDKTIDIAFVVLDGRLEKNYAKGMMHILSELHPRYVLPMHFWDDTSIVEHFKELSESKKTDTIILDTTKETHWELLKERNIMKFKMIHENYNVTDINRSLSFYDQALGLKEKRRKAAEDGSFIIVYIGNEESEFELELTWLKDHPQPYDIGEEEFHLAFKTDDFEAAHERHEKMACICYENPSMGIYFIQDPDGYWLEIIPTR